MNIQKTDENCFFIELSEKDMNTYNISLRSDGLYSEKDESLFLHILKENNEAPLFPKADISLLPGIRGGCIAVVKRKKEKPFPFAVYESEGLDAFLDLSKILSERSISLASSLYKGEDCFRLITENESEKAGLILCEFSESLPFPEREKEYTESFFQCLIRNKASEILCGK